MSRTQTRKDNADQLAKSQNQLRISGFAVLLTAVILFAVVSLVPGIHTWVTQRQELNDLRAQTERAKEELAGLSGERDKWSDPLYIRAQIRDRLYYVLPGEKNLLVINDLDYSADDQNSQISEDLVQTRVDWLGQLTASVLLAGLSDADPKQLEDNGYLKPAD